VSDLLHAWRDLLPLSAPVLSVSRVGHDLVARWSEPHRHYHTTRHLAAVLHVIDEHSGRAGDAIAVRLAAWFHDAVYDPRRVDNEEASALLAEASLPSLDVRPGQTAEVARLVRLTATHDPLPGDRNGGLLTDADLSILAAPPEEYRAYIAAIRQEYAHVSDEAFVAGRAAVLHNLLALTRLYHTPDLRERWEDLARHNLTWELSTLRNDPLPFAPL
jgi:predicted metal-dependent HD superfamily phosphohydrolase